MGEEELKIELQGIPLKQMERGGGWYWHPRYATAFAMDKSGKPYDDVGQGVHKIHENDIVYGPLPLEEESETI